MIVFDLECRRGQHRFEGWFRSSEDFARQEELGLLTCPNCGSADIGKALMAPHVGRKGNQMPVHAPSVPAPTAAPAPTTLPAPAPAEVAAPAVSSTPLPPEAMALMHKLARMQAEALKSSRFVGSSFAEDARAMHYGEREAETIHGQTTIEDARELLDEGIAVAPLPFPVVPPEQAN